jgi:hypothetical protein
MIRTILIVGFGIATLFNLIMSVWGTALELGEGVVGYLAAMVISALAVALTLSAYQIWRRPGTFYWFLKAALFVGLIVNFMVVTNGIKSATHATEELLSTKSVLVLVLVVASITSPLVLSCLFHQDERGQQSEEAFWRKRPGNPPPVTK